MADLEAAPELPRGKSAKICKLGWRRKGSICRNAICNYPLPPRCEPSLLVGLIYGSEETGNFNSRQGDHGGAYFVRTYAWSPHFLIQTQKVGTDRLAGHIEARLAAPIGPFKPIWKMPFHGFCLQLANQRCMASARIAEKQLLARGQRYQ